MNIPARKIILALIGLAAAFAATEAVLRLSGHVYYSFRMNAEKRMAAQEDGYIHSLSKPQDRSPTDVPRIPVLCVGDSYTFGQGAPAGCSYPAYLQRLCDEWMPRRFEVYNCGVPGFTSTKLRKKLETLIRVYNPSIIIVLIGLNDHSNPYVTEIMDMKKSEKSSAVTLWFRDLRTVKVLEYAFLGIRMSLSAGRDAADEGYRAIIKRGVEFELHGDTAAAEREFKRAIARNVNLGEAYLALGHLYAVNGAGAKALDTYRELIRVSPYDTRRTDLWRYLFLMYQCDKELRPEIRELMGSIPSDDYFVNPGKPFDLQQSAVIKSFRENISFMTDAARSRGMTMIMQTYPDSHGYVNGAIRDAALENGALLVDNEAVWRKNPGYAVYKVKDGHPDKRGYRIMAENVFDILRTQQERVGKWKK